jgi:hypothetical protein
MDFDHTMDDHWGCRQLTLAECLHEKKSGQKDGVLVISLNY